MTRALGPLLAILLWGCGDTPEPPPPAAAEAEPIDWEARARDWLAAHPRTTIATLGGDHEEKVMPLVGETRAEILTAVFPEHRFFEFRVSMFSGRRNPFAYVALRRGVEPVELLAYRDFGIDDAVARFFVQHAALRGRTEADAQRVLDAYRALSGLALDEATFTSTADDSVLRTAGAVLTFDSDGRLVRFSAK